jgi:hypothetical protein
VAWEVGLDCVQPGRTPVPYCALSLQAPPPPPVRDATEPLAIRPRYPTAMPTSTHSLRPPLPAVAACRQSAGRAPSASCVCRRPQRQQPPPPRCCPCSPPSYSTPPRSSGTAQPSPAQPGSAAMISGLRRIPPATSLRIRAVAVPPRAAPAPPPFGARHSQHTPTMPITLPPTPARRSRTVARARRQRAHWALHRRGPTAPPHVVARPAPTISALARS